MPEFDEQLEQPEPGNAELSNHGDLSDDELLAQFGQVSQGTFHAEPEQVVVDEPEQTEEDEDDLYDQQEQDQADEANEPAAVDPIEVTATDSEVASTPVAGEQTPVVAEVAVADTTDYKAFHEQVTRQFKANGRDLQVTSPEDIISLMQQGANYDKKMSSLKPAMQVHRTLEKAGLLDPEKIGFMIDLYHGKPEAVAKILADHEIDAYSLEGKSEGYVPQSRMASDSEVEISSIISELEQAPTFKETFDRLGSWDEQSQKKILDNPRTLRMYQEHKDAGIFDRIHQAIESERMFGRLQGMSDYDAYQVVGDQLFGNKPQVQAQAQPLAQSPVVQPQVIPTVAPAPISDPRVVAKQVALNQKRSAASAPRKVATASQQEQFNPLTVSDDELMEIAARNSRLM